MIKYLEKENDFQKEINKDKILVDFYAEWCGPCKKAAEILIELEKKESIDILKVNVDEFPEIAREYKIESIPTLILFKNTNIEKKEIGFRNVEELLEMIR